MLVARLSAQKYPMANPKKWLVFANPNQADIDPVFAGRLAAYGRDRGKQVHITGNGGARDPKDQVRAYVQSGGYQKQDGTWTGGNGLAAVPGISFHEIKLAIDVADEDIKATDKEASTAKQTTLLKYGIFKPLTKGNGVSKPEDWHIQPIETAGKSQASCRKTLFPLEVSGTLVDFQKAHGLKDDDIYGPLTDAKAKEVFKIKS